MNEISTVNSNALSMLPKDPQVVKVSRILKGLSLAGLVIVAGLAAIPLATAALSLAKFFAAGTVALIALVVLLLTVYGVPHLLRLGQMRIDAKAEELTWEYIERDPLVPGILYLRDIESEGEEYGDQLGNIEEVVEQITDKRDEALAKAQNAESRARQIDPASSEFKSFAHDVSVWNGVVERLNGRIANGQQMAKELGELYDVYKSKARDLRTEIDGQRTDWEASKIYDAGMDSAEKLLIKGSKRKEFAERAAKVIAENYIGTFGRLRSIRKLSGEIVTAYRSDQSAAAQQLLAKWQKEKQGLLPLLPAQNVPAATTVDTGAYSKVFNKQN